jgi:hypothetical protein
MLEGLTEEFSTRIEVVCTVECKDIVELVSRLRREWMLTISMAWTPNGVALE